MFERRTYPSRPIVAVSGMIVNQEGKILIVRRAKPPGKGKWSLPGGAVKLGETLHQALRREIQEECHISITIEKLLGAFDRIFFDEDRKVQYHYVILDYLCRTASPQIQPATDVDAFAWIGPTDMEKYSFTPGVKEFLLDVFPVEFSEEKS